MTQINRHLTDLEIGVQRGDATCIGHTASQPLSVHESPGLVAPGSILCPTLLAPQPSLREVHGCPDV